VSLSNSRSSLTHRQSGADRVVASVLGLPAWVQAWLAILIGANTASLAFLDSDVGRYTALAFAMVCLINLPTIVVQRGLTRLLSFPHFVWFPLCAYLVLQLWGAHPLPNGIVRVYALIVLCCNSISLAFDVIDAIKWVRGQREVLGLPA
jgi:hypothetical protein